MHVLAVDWATLSSLGTALGTLVLAVATFAAVRSGERSARISEIALQEQRRPVLNASRLEDPLQKMMFADRRWVAAEGGRGVALVVDGRVYLALSLRNVGSGMAVCQGWAIAPAMSTAAAPDHTPLERFHAQTRDIYIPGGDIGMWQGALRGPDDPERTALVDAIEAGETIAIELLYSDLVGEQRTVTRFALLPAGEVWYVSMSRHWHLDNDGPRRDPAIEQARRAILAEARLDAGDPAALTAGTDQAEPGRLVR